MEYVMSQTVAQSIAASLKATAHAYAAGDQVAPCAVLWPDPERLWEPVIPELQVLVPELFVLGAFAPELRTGPALWLRCIEARVIDGAPQQGTTPIFYLPGVSQERLRAAEDCPPSLSPLVETQYRGVTFVQSATREWTPYSLLVSGLHGLGLDLATGQATRDALVGALPSLMSEQVSHLRNRRLDSEFFNGLVAPDATGSLLQWLGNSDAFRQRHSEAEWKAFRENCKAEYRFDPQTDGPLEVAKQLAGRDTTWNIAWKRFAEAPGNHPGVVEWLKRATPKKPTMFDSAEVWPTLNEQEELALRQALESLKDRPQDEAIRKLKELEAHHSERVGYAWQKLGLSPLATALKPLARLAELCSSTPGAPTPDAFAAYYAKDGWRVDAAALATMALSETPEQHAALLGTLRAVYLPWLEATSRHLQMLFTSNGRSISKRAKPISPTPGRLVLFADGLRMDVAQQIVARLTSGGESCFVDWEWSTIPSVTATAKPASSPVADDVQGGEAGDQFTARLISTGQMLTQDRFITALGGRGWQCLKPGENGDPTGSAWTEAGTIDKRGHTEGWKLSRSIETEVRDLSSRIASLIKFGWKEIVVVTDHGWLLLPFGLPKVELKSYLAENRWGRCASMKSEAQTDLPTYQWHWNPNVAIATPPGVGCFRASTEYSHGGVSLQEMVTPVIRVKTSVAHLGIARIVEAKWTGARCRVQVTGPCEKCRVDVRIRQSDSESSLLADRQTPETTLDGKVTAFLEDDSDIGRDAIIVLLDQTGQVVDALPTIIGE
jgi:hypothetical protein